MNSTKIVLSLPNWVTVLLTNRNPHYADINERMKLVVELARQNVHHQTGGPFAAAIFEKQSGRLLSVGVNMVERSNCSAAHAEMVALGLGQKILGSYDLGSQKPAEYELVTSCEPCAMCLGAICWSGVHRVVCGARDEDARGIGFDEGDKPSDWVATLQKRGIVVQQDVLREEARQVLRQYVDEGGLIYNPGQKNIT
jgi:tRNA(Arg) A34 adenosine deaminase TadA